VVQIEAIKEEAKNFFNGSRGSHGWEHVERVHRLSLHIGRLEGADLKILEIAALLHDIGRTYQDRSQGEVCHAEKGAHLAKGILKNQGVNKKEIDSILHCILHHRFRNGHKPQTLEAKILFDADKLDSIGAVGIARAFLFAGEVGAKLHNDGVDLSATRAYSREDTAFREFQLKLRHVKDSLFTREGKRLAEERHRFMQAFFTRLQEETKGKA
jgi:uncharacterized protein